MLSSSSADAGFSQFVNILQWVCWKSDTYFGKVDKNGTSQTCPNCGAHTGKKELEVRIHNCPECGYFTTRDVAAAQVMLNYARGKELASLVAESPSSTACTKDLSACSMKQLGALKRQKLIPNL